MAESEGSYEPNRNVAAAVGSCPLAVVAAGCTAKVNPKQEAAAAKDPRQAGAIAEIQRLGGKVTVDEKSPDKPVIGVSLRHSEVTDAGLEVPQRIASTPMPDMDHTQVTDAGLASLAGLTNLQLLDMGAHQGDR